MQLHLAKGQIEAYSNKETRLLYILSGAVWLTRARDSQDYCAQVGDHILLPRGAWLIVGLSPAALEWSPIKGPQLIAAINRTVTTELQRVTPCFG